MHELDKWLSVCFLFFLGWFEHLYNTAKWDPVGKISLWNWLLWAIYNLPARFQPRYEILCRSLVIFSILLFFLMGSVQLHSIPLFPPSRPLWYCSSNPTITTTLILFHHSHCHHHFDTVSAIPSSPPHWYCSSIPIITTTLILFFHSHHHHHFDTVPPVPPLPPLWYCSSSPTITTTLILFLHSHHYHHFDTVPPFPPSPPFWYSWYTLNFLLELKWSHKLFDALLFFL